MKNQYTRLSFLTGLAALLFSSSASSGYPGAPDIHPELTQFFETALQANEDVQTTGTPTLAQEQNDL